MRFHSSSTDLLSASALELPPATDCCPRAKGAASASWESPGQCPPCSPVCRLVAHRIDPRNTATKLTTTTPAIPLSLPDVLSPCLPAYPILSSFHPGPSSSSRRPNHDSIFPAAPGTADEIAARHPSETQGRIAHLTDRGPPAASFQGSGTRPVIRPRTLQCLDQNLYGPRGRAARQAIGVHQPLHIHLVHPAHRPIVASRLSEHLHLAAAPMQRA
jgi:hypothetical protein